MAFNGTWKAERNENYDKFMEQMGERVQRFSATKRPDLFLIQRRRFTRESDEVAYL